MSTRSSISLYLIVRQKSKYYNQMSMVMHPTLNLQFSFISFSNDGSLQQEWASALFDTSILRFFFLLIICIRLLVTRIRHLQYESILSMSFTSKCYLRSLLPSVNLSRIRPLDDNNYVILFSLCASPIKKIIFTFEHLYIQQIKFGHL